MKNDPIESAIAKLDEIDARSTDGRKQLTKALNSRWNLVTAKAARVIGDALVIELANDLAAAFERLLPRGATLDKGCAAMLAIARALIKLEHDDSGLFLRGMRHVQMEPTWGHPVDTAAELRAVCAMGLAGSTYSYKFRELVHLLVDSEWTARAGAVRAIAALGSETASLLLRFKALSGDEEPEVLSDCFAGLLAIEGAEAVPLIGSFATAPEPQTREAAILALGESRRADAVEWLKQQFGDTVDAAERKCIMLALSTSRTEPAIEFLMDVARNGSAANSTLAVSALELHKRDERIRDQLKRALAARADPAVPR